MSSTILKNSLKRLYKEEKVSLEQLEKMLADKKITESDFKEITNK